MLLQIFCSWVIYDILWTTEVTEHSPVNLAKNTMWTVTDLQSPRKSCNLNVMISICMELITDCIISKYTFGQWSPNKRRETNYKSIYYGVIHLLEKLMLGMLYTTGRTYT